MKKFAYALFGIAILVISFYMLSPDPTREPAVPTAADRIEQEPAPPAALPEESVIDPGFKPAEPDSEPASGSESAEKETFFLEPPEDTPFGPWDGQEFPPFPPLEDDGDALFGDLPPDDFDFGMEGGFGMDAFGNNEDLTMQDQLEKWESLGETTTPQSP